jgi:hypothetical protein
MADIIASRFSRSFVSASCPSSLPGRFGPSRLGVRPRR